MSGTGDKITVEELLRGIKRSTDLAQISAEDAALAQISTEQRAMVIAVPVKMKGDRDAGIWSVMLANGAWLNLACTGKDQ